MFYIIQVRTVEPQLPELCGRDKFSRTVEPQLSELCGRDKFSSNN